MTIPARVIATFVDCIVEVARHCCAKNAVQQDISGAMPRSEDELDKRYAPKARSFAQCGGGSSFD
ncbi:hypothetical protein R4P47_13425 [Rhodococcus sp. IEGM 1370]|uniref:hypothetical protein n=1 Tax=Rhodococcus sp. IEGM 1370 TaxID=3082222 RepID=UPI0029551B06|nr:hypothetical protein [Rhodococcus sp. IEGM 1370]MDV8077562.1 hypothetical protein [Rhodococcus sp. IEGM 1370]